MKKTSPLRSQLHNTNIMSGSYTPAMHDLSNSLTPNNHACDFSMFTTKNYNRGIKVPSNGENLHNIMHQTL